MLVITSYEADAPNTAAVIRDFAKGCEKRHIKLNVVIESLNCDRFSDALSWKDRIRGILSKFRAEDVRPDMIMILGQEGMASYLSMDISELSDIPVICGMVSRNYVEIPDVLYDLQTWNPETHDVSDISSLYNIVGGYFYDYDIDGNIALVRKYFPKIKRIAVLTDNSYGGVCMKSFVGDHLNRYPEYEFKWLDGRELTILSAADSISHLPDSTALLFGTWRFDKNNRFYLNSSISMLRQENPKMPVICLTATGLKEWGFGGYSPDYDSKGDALAECVQNYLETGRVHLNFEPNYYYFNYNNLEQFGIPKEDLPKGCRIVAKPESLIDAYKVHILIAIALILTLSIGLGIAVYQMQKNRRLKKELEKSRDELAEAKNKAEASSLLKTTFLTDMSHEIRTPLNAIVGFSEVIATQTDLTKSEKANIMEVINKNCKLLTGLLNSILDISRIESGRASYSFEEWDVVEICRTAMTSVQIAHGGNNIEFVFETNLWACPLNTDRQRLQQVLNNLLNNAVKFTDSGSITLNLSRDDVNHLVRIEVSDTGRGIPANRADDVFRRFVKLDEYSTGTGLGLSLCKMIVERFGGKIWVDTAYTQGARIVFTLPELPIGTII